MIAKHIPIRSLRKSDFANLVTYITDAQNKTERLGQVQITNCEASSLQDAIMDVMATQRINTRATGDKTYHLLVAFPAGENPSASVLKEIEERLCTGLGYGEHQRISALHHDTDHLHIHIAINKIHPTRHTMHEPFQAYRTLGDLCTELEQLHGLQQVNHAFCHRISENRALDMEKHSGLESLVSWIKRTCLNELSSAQSWKELHEVLHKNGLELRERANGFVIEADEGPMVKASTIARDFSKQKLETRLGPFEAFLEQKGQKRRQYQKEPLRLRVNTSALYAKYKIEQQTLRESQEVALKKIQRHMDREIKAAKRANCLRRATIKVIGEGRAVKKLLYAQASYALRTEIQTISKKYQKERQDLYGTHKRCTWADWLQKEAIQGNVEALAVLRACEGTRCLKGNTVQGEGQPRHGPIPVIDTITKKGTIIFRAGMSAVRDDGNKLQVSREATFDGLQEALRLALKRYGNRITVNGTALFKAQIIRAAVNSQHPITFTDPVLERRRQDIRCTLLKKENTHERSEHDRGCDRERTRRGTGHAESSIVTKHDATRVGLPDGRNNADSIITQKSNIKRIGRIPPPQSQHRLRTLSQLDVVRIPDRGEVLLPHDVPHHVEQQGTKPDHALRRRISKPGMNQKWLKGIGRPKHFRYTTGDDSVAGSSKGSIKKSKRRR
ncbi:MAG: conjugal transfer protein TraI [Alphaproteobacteria bacterium 41-28]|nr:MAG: conjugal transfer protein TraI [Alphaproteobacteria bacterium 41-28]